MVLPPVFVLSVILFATNAAAVGIILNKQVAC